MDPSKFQQNPTLNQDANQPITIPYQLLTISTDMIISTKRFKLCVTYFSVYNKYPLAYRSMKPAQNFNNQKLLHNTKRIPKHIRHRFTTFASIIDKIP